MSVVLDILAEIILAISFYQEKFSCLDQKDIHQEYLQMHFIGKFVTLTADGTCCLMETGESLVPKTSDDF